MEFPNGKRFAFTIFDDTDEATVSNVKPVYDLLCEAGLRTTKSAWVFPTRGRIGGQCLQDEDYREFVLDLQNRGFEIGLHSVGDGAFSRAEIIRGIEQFERIVGHSPKVHTNHVSNPDNIYWLDDRFEWPFNVAYRGIYRWLRGRSAVCGGSTEGSDFFWGDVFKRKVKYIRNLTFNEIDTLACDPRMPYQCKRKSTYSNYWFSSSDGDTVREMNALLSPENCDRLEKHGGVCIAYTHFAYGFVNSQGQLHPEFEKNIRYLAAKAGWFVPVSTLLDYLLDTHSQASDPGYIYHLTRNLLWFFQRVNKKLRFGR